MGKITLLIIFVLNLMNVWSYADELTLAALLPKEGEVKGWKIYPDTYKYCQGENLTEIYNGGYQLYTHFGVLEAATQIYTASGEILNVVVHRLERSKDALSFYSYWRESAYRDKSFKTLKLRGKGFIYSPSGSTIGYWVGNSFLASFTMGSGGGKASGIVEAFVKSVDAKLSGKGNLELVKYLPAENLIENSLVYLCRKSAIPYVFSQASFVKARLTNFSELYSGTYKDNARLTLFSFDSSKVAEGSFQSYARFLRTQKDYKTAGSPKIGQGSQSFKEKWAYRLIVKFDRFIIEVSGAKSLKGAIQLVQLTLSKLKRPQKPEKPI